MTWNPRDAEPDRPQPGGRFVPPTGYTAPPGQPPPGVFGAYQPEALPTLEPFGAWGEEEGSGMTPALEAALAAEGLCPPGLWERWRQMMVRGYPDLGCGGPYGTSG